MHAIINKENVRLSNPEIRLEQGTSENLIFSINWDGDFCQHQLTNNSKDPVKVREVVLFSGNLPDEDIPFYGEGFQQNGQRGGTLRRPEDIGFVPDRKEYKLPQVANRLTVYSLVVLSPINRTHTLMAFTSCNRFSGEFRFSEKVYEVVMDTEGLWLAPGEKWCFEEFMIACGDSKTGLLNRLAERIEMNHPRLIFPETPTGWCSWYHYGPDITEEDVIRNLDIISKEIPGLKYIQIDDGYQPFMGDWLEPGSKFPHGMRWLCDQIRQRGFEPAIWVAPFIAEGDSKVFREHPDWFLTGKDGKPITAGEVSYEGWRCTPWYVLDGTHIEVQQHFTKIFSRMREDWGCSYFKLDASFWGAIQFCKHADPSATRIEAYRRGMQAILRGSGNAFILGCNAPVWGSLGLIHGNRATNDIMRYWEKFKSVALELFHRNWQNNRLWINDPDCIILNNIAGSNLSPDEFSFHIAMIQASGGMILSGDNVTALNPSQLEILRRLLPPVNQAAHFLDDNYNVGIQDFKDHQILFCFNYDEKAKSFEFDLPKPVSIKDYWSGEDLGIFKTTFRTDNISAHGAMVFYLEFLG
jgi:alpha-galactosidase